VLTAKDVSMGKFILADRAQLDPLQHSLASGEMTSLPGGHQAQPHATMPSCSTSADRKQLATGSFISQAQLSQYSSFGGCCGSTCCDGPARSLAGRYSDSFRGISRRIRLFTLKRIHNRFVPSSGWTLAFTSST
jgi:hypothetical protein